MSINLTLEGFITRIDQFNNVFLLPDPLTGAREKLIKHDIIKEEEELSSPIKIKNKHKIDECINNNVQIKVILKSYSFKSKLLHNLGEKITGKSLFLQSIIKI